MSDFTITVPCPRVTVETPDDHQECECDVEVSCTVYGEYRRATWGYDGGSPEEFPELDYTPVTACPTSGVAYTAEEQAQIDRVIAKTLDNHTPNDDRYIPCRCGDLCRC